MTENGRKPAPQPSATKIAGDALDHLRIAMALCDRYRKENEKLLAALEEVAKMGRDGKSARTITFAVEQFVKDAQERMAKAEKRPC